MFSPSPAPSAPLPVSDKLPTEFAGALVTMEVLDLSFIGGILGAAVAAYAADLLRQFVFPAIVALIIPKTKKDE